MKKILFIISFVIALVSCMKVEEPFIHATTDLIEAPSDMDFYPIIIVKSEHYTIETNCNWVVVDTTYIENGSDKIIFKCAMNPTTKDRSTNINIEGESFLKQVNVIQHGRKEKIVKTGDSLYVYLTNPGALYKLYNSNGSKEYGKDNWTDVKKITIEGTTNAMDYACIKQNFRNVEYLDLSNTTIEYYQGSLGTMDWGNPIEYRANALPNCAFWYGSCWCKWERPTDEEMDFSMLYLKHVKLPNSITKIDFWAFAGAISLEEITIPEGVTTIGEKNRLGGVGGEANFEYEGNVFYNCWNLKKVYIPSTVNTIGSGSFINCYALEEVHIASKDKPNEILSEWGNYMTFGKAIDWKNMLDAEWGLESGVGIMHGGWSGEYYIAKTNATLYVPKGCKDNYKEWEKYFQNIVEE